MNRLKILRCEKGLVQKDISNYLHCSIAIISMYEKEQRVMDINTAQKLANYFECSVDYLLGKSDIRNDKDFIVFNGFKMYSMDNYDISKYANDFQDDNFLSNYNKLNAIGKSKVNEMIADLLQIHKYTEEPNEN